MSEWGAHGGRVALDLPYGRHPAQCLDLYLPEDATPRPLVMFVHGGGWSVGDKAQYAAVGARLASEGIIAAIINYRLSPAVQHPAHVQDVARAVRWCARHGAQYGADGQALALMGHSSGAHLAALVALDPQYLAAEGLGPETIRCVLGVAGVGYDLDAHYATPQLRPFFDPVFGADPGAWEAAAPIRYVSAAAPSFGLVHGLADSEAPPASTERFAAALRRAGVPTDLRLLEDEGHISVMFAAAPLAIAFVRRGGPAGPRTVPRCAPASASVVGSRGPDVSGASCRADVARGEAVRLSAAVQARRHAFDRCRTAFDSCRAAFARLQEAHRLEGPRSPRYRVALATWQATLANYSELRALDREQH